MAFWVNRHVWIVWSREASVHQVLHVGRCGFRLGQNVNAWHKAHPLVRFAVHIHMCHAAKSGRTDLEKLVERTRVTWDVSVGNVRACTSAFAIVTTPVDVIALWRREVRRHEARLHATVEDRGVMRSGMERSKTPRQS